MADPAHRRLAAWSAAAIFLGAFLLFQVQPIISKMILPWFGGSPAVWTTAMLFFQTLLLAGYFYAHLAARLPPRWAVALHLTLLATALATLPITPSDAWRPADGSWPVARILALLTVSVGLPYLLLAATSPLVQAWLACLAPSSRVYRLYALSNIGSLGALLTYPVLVEPLFSTRWQGWMWSGGLAGYAVVCAALAAIIWRRRPIAPVTAPVIPAEAAGAPFAPRLRQAIVWLAGPALGSVTLLAVTHHLCHDIAVVPFLWIAPLSLYLLTFIIAFERDAWYSRRRFAAGTVICILAVSLLGRSSEIQHYYDQLGVTLPLRALGNNAIVQGIAYLALLFLLCMLCHGETARARPAPRWLTLFYLMIAAGGAMGGALSALVFPYVFTGFWELSLAIALGFVLSAGLLTRDAFKAGRPAPPAAAAAPAAAPRRRRKRGRSAAVESPAQNAAASPSPAPQHRRMPLALGAAAAVAGAFVVAWAQLKALEERSIARGRNFYGVLRVEEMFEDEPEHHGRVLYHGRIMHGYQLLDPARRNTPTAYFHQKSGIGRLMRGLPQRPRRVGVVGLGAGALAAYAESGDIFRFYEINPLVTQYALEHFTFLRDCRADTLDLVPGDARVSLEGEAPQEYDILVIDAFSGDAIPTHLLTREAMEVYLRHLREQGTLAFHISNRYVDLRPVVAALAEASNCRAALVQDNSEDRMLKAPSDWVIVSRVDQAFESPDIRSAARPLLESGKAPVLWTDQFSNLLGVMK